MHVDRSIEANAATAFWRTVSIGSPQPHVAELGACWVRLCPTMSAGYTMVRWFNRQTLAHRLAWMLHYGDVPDRLCVLHRCDNRICVRPSHLFLGTRRENSEDMATKGRGRSKPRLGMEHHRAVLTDEKVIRIRALYDSKTYNQYELAALFSVSQPNIGYIVRRDTWKHIA